MLFSDDQPNFDTSLREYRPDLDMSGDEGQKAAFDSNVSPSARATRHQSRTTRPLVKPGTSRAGTKGGHRKQIPSAASSKHHRTVTASSGSDTYEPDRSHDDDENFRTAYHLNISPERTRADHNSSVSTRRSGKTARQPAVTTVHDSDIPSNSSWSRPVTPNVLAPGIEAEFEEMDKCRRRYR